VFVVLRFAMRDIRYWKIHFQVLDNYFAELGKHSAVSGKNNADLRKKKQKPTCQKRKTDLPKMKNRLANIGYTG
jgi:hypothetical protein